MRPWVTTTVAVLGPLVAFMSLAAWREWPWWEYAFLSDGSPVSWLSSALLVANGAVALSLGTSAHLSKRFAYPLAVGLACLAIDEQFQMHERVKERVGGGIGDAAMLITAVLGVAFVFLLARVLPRGSARTFLVLAVAVGLFAIWIDLGTPSAFVARLEEAFEVASEGLFLCALIEIGRGHVQSLS